MAATPPPASRIHTPPAPHYGALHDSYEPYSPRRSRRVQERQQKSPNPDTSPTRVKRHTNRATTPPSKKISTRNVSQTFSPPSSPASPRFQKSSPRKSTIQRSETFASQDTVKQSSLLHPHSSIDPTASLPTPSKTPRKKQGPSQAKLGSTSRILFPSRPATIDEAMPTPRKGKHSRHASSYGLDGYVDEQDADVSDNIEIYTDSNERVPTNDEDPDNPFIDHEPPQSNTKASKKRRRHLSSNEKRMEEAVKNGEGMIYVFRGKRVFRSFDDNANGAAVEEETSARARQAAGPAAHKPLTRSSYKPRLLFPNDAQIQARQANADEDDDDREAATDIDERIASIQNGNSHKHHQPNINAPDPATADHQVITPTTTTAPQSFGPTTPPSTGRATRSSTRAKEPDTSPLMRGVATTDSQPGEEDAASSGQHKKLCPFDVWQRAKNDVRSVSGTKREGEPMEGAVGKRTRSGPTMGS